MADDWRHKLKYRVWDYTDRKMLYFEGIFNRKPFDFDSVTLSKYGVLVDGHNEHKLGPVMQNFNYRVNHDRMNLWEQDIVYLEGISPKEYFYISLSYSKWVIISIKNLSIVRPLEDVLHEGIIVAGNVYENRELWEGV